MNVNHCWRYKINIVIADFNVQLAIRFLYSKKDHYFMLHEILLTRYCLCLGSSMFGRYPQAAPFPSLAAFPHGTIHDPWSRSVCQS